jgi:hypothetical protein
MIMNRYFSLILILVLVSSICSAQNETEKLDNRILYTKYYVSDFFTPTSKWAWEVDVVYRRQSELGSNNIFQHPLRFSIRPFIAYQFTKYSRLSVNPIGMFRSAPRYPLESDLSRPFEREWRTTVQLLHYAYFGRVNFTHRLRGEYRWRGIDDPQIRQNMRFRYRMRVRIPINTNYFYTDKTWYTSIYSEPHVEWGRDVKGLQFTQLRNFIGLGYRFWGWTRIELGYLLQLNMRANGNQMDLSQGPMFYLFFDVLSRNSRRYDYSF